MNYRNFPELLLSGNLPTFQWDMSDLRTRIKVCGITRAEDAHAAIACGVDALGFVFVQESPRYCAPHKAVEIINSLPPFVTVVALFMNNAPEEIQSVLREQRFDLLQFHGDEGPENCARYALPYIKAIPMGGQTDIHAYAKSHARARGFLLDSHAPGAAGGSGQVFDWKRIPGDFEKPVILAGGLNPENVARAICEAKPFAVDVSSGVERAKGIKDANKIAAFVKAVQEGDKINARNH